MALTENENLTFVAGSVQYVGVPVAANAVIFKGAALESDSGDAAPVSGAGTFLGFADEALDATGLSDGDRSISVAVKGLVELTITTDAVTRASIGATIEATDDGTFRIEPGSAITGTVVGKIARVLDATAKRVIVAFEADFMRSI